MTPIYILLLISLPIISSIITLLITKTIRIPNPIIYVRNQRLKRQKQRKDEITAIVYEYLESLSKTQETDDKTRKGK
jgi:hypothetical protein